MMVFSPLSLLMFLFITLFSLSRDLSIVIDTTKVRTWNERTTISHLITQNPVPFLYFRGLYIQDLIFGLRLISKLSYNKLRYP